MLYYMLIMSERQILGVSGLARSGKSALINRICTDYGFQLISASHVIKTDLAAKTGNLNPTREQLHDHGDRLRHVLGPDFIVRLGLRSDSSRILFDGIRNLCAQRSLYEAGGKMLGLVALADVRYKRGQDALGDKPLCESLEDFVHQEQSELNSNKREGLQILPVLWNIEPQAIIDTTFLSRESVAQVADSILQNWGFLPL